MKKLFIVVALLVFYSLSCFSQDLIFLKTGSLVKAEVLEVHDDEIKYKKYSNLNGPAYFISMEKVNKIVYSNGHVEWFNEKTSKPKNSEQEITYKKTDYPKIEYIPRARKAFLVDGKIISLESAADYLKVNKVAYDNFVKAQIFKSQYITTDVFFWIFMLGGPIVSVATDTKGPFIAALAGVSITLVLGLVFRKQSKKYYTKAVKIYNEGLPYACIKKTRKIFSVKVGITSNGIGLCLNL